MKSFVKKDSLLKSREAALKKNLKKRAINKINLPTPETKLIKDLPKFSIKIINF